MKDILLERYYADNYDKLVKGQVNRAGSVENAEDIVQEAFARALKYLERCRATDMSSFEAWFVGILNNAFIDFMKEERHYGMGLELPEDSVVDVDECKEEVRDLILKEIGHRKQPARSILFMHFIQEMPVREIASVLDCQRGAVNQALKRFRKQFKELYGAELVE